MNCERTVRTGAAPRRMWLGLTLIVMTVPSLAHGAEHPTFNRDIRPILSDFCFQCHGPDQRNRQAGLRLDVRDLALQPAESGRPAIVPRQPDQSELLRRILSTDPAERMPPPETGKRLTAGQIERLRTWIREGAEYQGHWAFLKPERPAVPRVAEATAVQNPIDAFVAARLEREALRRSPEADRTTLLRRVSLDLIGLPPTPQETAAFLADSAPGAYERVVDRLLQSPHYGERMALPWLDFARYADSNGFQVDSSRQMWPWRDWVIDAFNRNLPFDQFTVEQLAGDLLPNPSRSQLVATGFHRNHRLNGEGGIIAEEWRVETVIDRVETTGLTWLGLTLNCCRCHDHKYDPITQKEFYQLFAFFNNVPESGTLQGESRNTDPVIPVATAEHQAELARLDAELHAAQARVTEVSQQLPALVAAWEPKFREQFAGEAVAWNPFEPTSVKSLEGATLTRQEDGSYLASGTNPPNDTYEITGKVSGGTLTGVLLEALPDPSLPNQSLGRYPNGNFVLSRVEASVLAAGGKEPVVAKFVRAQATYSQPNWDIANTVGADRRKGWAVDGNDPAKRLVRRAMFLIDPPVQVPADATVTIRLRHEALAQHNVGRFRLSTTGLPIGTVTLEGSKVPPSLRAALAVPVAERTPAQQAEITKFYRDNVDNPVKRAEADVAAIRQKREALEKSFPSVMVMKELDKPRDAFLLVRGQYDRRGDKVTAALPALLPPLPADAPMNRLGLARWMVDPSHPLTARVWVNRTWEKFFGVGLVKTSENFGSQAEFPSHPDLLDWLACEFREPTVTPPVAGTPPQAWDMKAFQKLIVMSATYRQSSRVTPELLQRDPDNRLLARGPRFRLSAELIRDQALAAAGLLVPKIGGPSTRPYMPNGVWDETSRYGDLRNYKPDEGEGLYRRSLYTVWKRTAAPPSMLLFDAPNREICTVKRSRTNTPLQALALLNEVTFVEAARKLGERMLREGGESVDARLTYGFRLVTGRSPDAEELVVLRDGLESDLKRFQTDTMAATQITTFGAAKPDPKYSAAELAAYALAGNVLLNLDEFITRE